MSETVFNFEGNWSKVLEVLDNPLAIRALNAGMTGWCDVVKRIWTPDRGPWAYSKWDCWDTDAQNNFESSGQSKEHDKWCKMHGCPDRDIDPKGWDDWLNSQAAWDHYDVMIKPFYPQPRTVDWYRCYGACHWLAVWNCAIGALLFPENDWEVVKGENHSTAFSMRLGLYMDILWGHDHTENQIWEGVTDNGVSQCGALMEEIEWLETRPYRKELVCHG